MNRYLIPLGVFLLLVLFLGIGLKLNPREVPSPLVNRPAPTFELPQLHEPARKLAVDLWRRATGQTTPEKLHLIVPAEVPARANPRFFSGSRPRQRASKTFGVEARPARPLGSNPPGNCADALRPFRPPLCPQHQALAPPRADSRLTWTTATFRSGT